LGTDTTTDQSAKDEKQEVEAKQLLPLCQLRLIQVNSHRPGFGISLNKMAMQQQQFEFGNLLDTVWI
jgi:hypothetical protein